MNILFLDVDGVLNCAIREEHQINQWNLRNLKFLVDRLGFNVVISSDWRRLAVNMDRLKNELRLVEIEIFSTTIISDCARKKEIENWLKDHDWSKALILDDEPAEIVDPKIHNCLFHRTNHILGLTEEDVDSIIGSPEFRFSSDGLRVVPEQS